MIADIARQIHKFVLVWNNPHRALICTVIISNPPHIDCDWPNPGQICWKCF